MSRKSIETGAHKGFEPEAKPAPPVGGRLGPLRKFKVTVMYLKPLVIAAASPEEAFEKFKLLNGLISTDHEPEIMEATGEEEEIAPKEKGKEGTSEEGPISV